MSLPTIETSPFAVDFYVRFDFEERGWSRWTGRRWEFIWKPSHVRQPLGARLANHIQRGQLSRGRLVKVVDGTSRAECMRYVLKVYRNRVNYCDPMVVLGTVADAS